jgi:hypothetical protein
VSMRRHDSRHNDIQYNGEQRDDNQHYGLNCYTRD